jgi:phosphate transport system substrate-binding protein
MNDEFLKALRRDPPPQFARRLKQQLQAQDAQAKRRSWSLRTRTLLFLLVGSAFAGGVWVIEKRGSVESTPVQSQAQAQNAAAPPGSATYRPRSLGPGFIPEGNGATTNVFDGSQPSAASSPTNGFSAQSGQTTASAAGVASSAAEQTTSGGSIRSQALPSIAISPLVDGLFRNNLGRFKYKQTDTPRLQTIATDAAFSGFCSPGNARQFDMVVSSRRVRHAEFTTCRDNGIDRIIEVKLGYQALVLTSARDSLPMKLSAGDVYLALAGQIPDPADPTRLIDNTNFTWDQVDARLAYRPITVFGPMRDAPMRLLFETLLLEPGCSMQRAIKPLQTTAPDRYAELCHSLRDDRLYSEVEQNANLIPQNLWSDPHGFVLVDYGFYLDYRSQLAGSALEGPEPSYATFADGTYPFAHPVYLHTDETRLNRTIPVLDDLQYLQRFSRLEPNRFGFVRAEERESRPKPWRQKAPLTESDLISPRSASR